MKTSTARNIVTLLVLFLGNMALAQGNIALQPGISGSWIADADGQGVVTSITRVNDEPVFAMSWYAYKDGKQVWLVGAQPIAYGDTLVTVPLTIARGADWGENFRPEDVVKEEWGTVTLSFSDCRSGSMTYESNDAAFGSGEVALTRLTFTDGLSCREDNSVPATVEDSLKFMREEEKMARDVYRDFYQRYGVIVFDNVASSEQRHMDAVLTLMTVYNVPDSSTGEAGTFNNPDLQALYDALVSQGASSLNSAYLAAALIEETDIRDIEAAKESITAEDVIATYDNLLCGSRNHLRSFVAQYESATGQPYQVQLPELADEVAEILSSPTEQCGRP